MPPARRYKGRFITDKQLNKKMKCMEATKKRRDEIRDIRENGKKCMIEGRRIIELEVMSRFLNCVTCGELLSLIDIEKETRFGLASIFHVKCEKCSLINFVPSGRHDGTGRSDGRTYAVNTEAVQGCINAGIDLKVIKKFLNLMGIPGETSKIFQPCKDQIGPETKQAAEERKRQEAVAQDKKQSETSKKGATKRKGTPVKTDTSKEPMTEDNHNLKVALQQNTNNGCADYRQNMNSKYLAFHQNVDSGITTSQQNVNTEAAIFQQNITTEVSISQQNLNNEPVPFPQNVNSSAPTVQQNYNTEATMLHKFPHKKAMTQLYNFEQNASQHYLSTSYNFQTNPLQYMP